MNWEWDDYCVLWGWDEMTPVKHFVQCLSHNHMDVSCFIVYVLTLHSLNDFFFLDYLEASPNPEVCWLHSSWFLKCWYICFLLFLFQIKNFLFFYGDIVDLQCFRSISKVQSDSVRHIYLPTYLSLFRFFSIIDYYKILNIVPCAIQ